MALENQRSAEMGTAAMNFSEMEVLIAQTSGLQQALESTGNAAEGGPDAQAQQRKANPWTLLPTQTTTWTLV